MLTKADFLKEISNTIQAYPAVAPLFEAGDPRILMHLEAVAAMFGMLSAQVEACTTEPFTRSRGATVLADAAMRGIIRKATPARVRVLVTNNSTAEYTMASGRTLTDSQGFPYRVETTATAAAGGTATVEAVQLRQSDIVHTVSGSEPFYAIEIPSASDGANLAGVSVSDSAGTYVHRDRYTNTASGERVFHIEADDRQRVYVRFGMTDHVGVQPADGTAITLHVSYSAGSNASPAAGSPFAFDYIAAPVESEVDLAMDSLLIAGQAPISISMLRELARYPSVYDSNAVYLGEFDFLVRRSYPTLPFLSVWNESAEEIARGASQDNINALFVACLSATGAESVLTESSPLAPVAPTIIPDASLTPTQQAIKATILSADDSYRVKFYTPVRSKIAISIIARVPTSYVAAAVQAQIREAILAEYGEAAAASRRGFNKPLYQRVYALLINKVPGLAAGGNADLQVSIQDVSGVSSRPELWRYVAPDSLDVAVQAVNTVPGSWGG